MAGVCVCGSVGGEGASLSDREEWGRTFGSPWEGNVGRIAREVNGKERGEESEGEG